MRTFVVLRMLWFLHRCSCSMRNIRIAFGPPDDGRTFGSDRLLYYYVILYINENLLAGFMADGADFSCQFTFNFHIFLNIYIYIYIFMALTNSSTMCLHDSTDEKVDDVLRRKQQVNRSIYIGEVSHVCVLVASSSPGWCLFISFYFFELANFFFSWEISQITFPIEIEGGMI